MWNMLNDGVLLFGKEFNVGVGSLLLGLMIAQAICIVAVIVLIIVLAVKRARERAERENREKEEDAARRLLEEVPEIASDPNVMTLRRTRRNGSQLMIAPPEVAEEVHEYVGKLCGQLEEMIPAMISVARPVSQSPETVDARTDAEGEGKRRRK